MSMSSLYSLRERSLEVIVGVGFYFQVNRSSMTFLARQAFAKMFKSDPDDLVTSGLYYNRATSVATIVIQIS